MSTDPSKESAPAAPARQVERGIRIFTYPKIIFLYPSFFAAILCGFLMLVFKEVPASSTPASAPDPTTTATATAPAAAKTANQSNFSKPQNIIAVVFLGILFINYVVIALDFPRFTVFAGIFLGTTVLLILVLLGERLDVFSFFSRIFGPLYMQANAAFYFIYATILLLVFGQVFTSRYLDYWEVLPNEILHHHGPWSDFERFPTINLRFDKEIPDIFEFLMAGSGRLVLTVQGEPRSFVLDNVPKINKVESRLKELMSNLRVSS